MENLDIYRGKLEDFICAGSCDDSIRCSDCWNDSLCDTLHATIVRAHGIPYQKQLVSAIPHYMITVVN